MAAAAKIVVLLIVVYLQYATDNNFRALITGRLIWGGCLTGSRLLGGV